MTATKEQIVAEAERRWENELGEREWSAVDYIIEVIREGWKPVDPDVLAVREIVAVAFENANSIATAKGARLGTYDAEPLVLAALAAYKAGRAAR
jgi:hypothetical protein